MTEAVSGAEIEGPGRSASPPRLLLLTDGGERSTRALGDLLLGFFEDGLRAVIVRERHRPQHERELLAARLIEVSRSRGCFVALATPAPSHLAAHLRADERRTTSPGHIGGTWGRSCHSVAEVDRARAEGASWVTLSPFAASLSKPGHGPAPTRRRWDPENVRTRPRGGQIGDGEPSRSRFGALPVYALAGVTPTNIADAMRWSGYGAAVHGAVWQSNDPGFAMRELVHAVEAVTERSQQAVPTRPRPHAGRRQPSPMNRPSPVN